ncbi:sensor histidine kinase [Haloarcula nitratireducens]|uniref:histidine kinase n=1 Tax=Haloarcula nitratireducens TaxID=2487749 RepID=A0AAW4PD33_9EURY|nr:ATP-binding protein [Halomicroarcula nitratireducens]MBX0295642.1 PAS domain S-box protein [Halomicroarcula nitratireducens]
MAGDGRVLERALDTLDDVFYVYDASGRLIHWNRRLNELFGLSDAELDGMLPMEFFEEADQPAVEAAMADIFETGETVVEAWAETTQGRVRFELTGRLLTDGDGSMLGFAGVGRDVTDRREQAWHLAKQNERLEEFADVLAHDLRSPLAVANGYLELTQTTGETGHLADIAAAHERMEHIIEDVRTATREGALAADVEPVDLAAVTGEAWETVETDGEALELPSELIVDADARRLRRLFENLFRNCVDHGSTEYRPVTVRVVATDRGFAVEDDGPGIDPADREAVFDPGISRGDGGTGFGLYIVRTIAEAHGWSVTVTGGDEGGARFEFDLRGAA